MDKDEKDLRESGRIMDRHCGCGHDGCADGHADNRHDGCIRDHEESGACECPSCSEKSEKLKVTSLLHDNAVVVSAEYHTAADREKAGELLTGYMEALAGKIDCRGGMIGHIKTSVEVRYVEMYSLTDKTVMKKTTNLPDLTLYMAAIVFCIKEEELLCLVRDMFGDMDRQLHES